MKVYKNPWVTRESYFVKTGAAGTTTTVYVVEFWNGKWTVEEAKYYTRDVKTMPVVAENNINLKDVIRDAILSAVHDAAKEQRMVSADD
jgi:hypothetical protein